MDFSKIIIQRRKELKLTQRDLAEKLNVSDKTVSRWEVGTQLPDTSIIPDLAKVLEITIEQLYGETNTKLLNNNQIDWNLIGRYKAMIIISLLICSLLGLTLHLLPIWLSVVLFLIFICIFIYNFITFKNFYETKFYNLIYYQVELKYVSLFILVFGLSVFINSMLMLTGGVDVLTMLIQYFILSICNFVMLIYQTNIRKKQDIKKLGKLELMQIIAFAISIIINVASGIIQNNVINENIVFDLYKLGYLVSSIINIVILYIQYLYVRKYSNIINDSNNM